MRTFLTVFTLAVHLTLLDAVVKELASAFLKAAMPVVVIPGFFNLAYVENRGCAWGLLQGHVWPLALFGVAALVFLIWKRREIFSLKETGWRRRVGGVAEWLLYAGICGNLIDRVYRGFVIDMFDFHWGASHFPCFNLADSYICVAAGLLLALSLFSRQGK